MKFITLDGNQIVLEVKPSQYPRVPTSSGPQKQVGDFLEEKMPNQILFEEFVIPRSGGLRIDFYLPNLKTAIEVDGAQHSKYTAHFHQDKLGFQRAKVNDKNKEQWCNLNGIRLIRVGDSDPVGDLREQLK